MGDDGIKDAYRTGRGIAAGARGHEHRGRPRRGGRRSCSPRCRSRRASTRSRASSPSWSRAGKIDGVRDIRNESGQGSTRLVIELRADANPQIVLNNLFKHTPAQITFAVNMVALVDGVPRTINLQEALQEWVDHQVVVVTRRTQFRLEKAEARLHIVEGLVKALDMIDAIVALIKASKDRAAARTGLDGRGLRVQRDPGQSHPRHARSAGSRSSGATSSSTNARSSRPRSRSCASILAQPRRADGRDPRRARRDPRRSTVRRAARRSSPTTAARSNRGAGRRRADTS